MMADLISAVETHENLEFIKESGILAMEKSSQEEFKESEENS